MALKFKIKKGDKVIVLTGRDKGRQGEVVKMLPSESRAIVGGINQAKRHTKQSRTSAGGIIAKDLPIQISNLALVDPKTGLATRVGFKILDDGRKVRFAKRSGEIIDV